MAKKLLRKLSLQELMSAAKGTFGVDIETDLTEAQEMDNEARTSGILTKSEIPEKARDSYVTELENRLQAQDERLKKMEELFGAAVKSAGDGGMTMPACADPSMTLPGEAKAKDAKVPDPANDNEETEPAPDDEAAEEKMPMWAKSIMDGIKEVQAVKGDLTTMSAQLAQAMANMEVLQKQAKTAKRPEAPTANALTPDMTEFIRQQMESHVKAESDLPFSTLKLD